MAHFFSRTTTLTLLAVAAMPAMLAAQTADPAAAPAKPVKEKKICRTIGDTGSRLGGKRSCHTSDEWAEIDKMDSQRTGITVVRSAGPTHQ